MGTSLTDLLVEGLTAAVTKAEREAARRPPYPTPAARVRPRDGLLRELVARLPADADEGGPATVTRIKGRTRAYRSVVSSLGRPPGFDFGDAACALLAVGALTDPDVETLAEFLPTYCGVRRQQVSGRPRAREGPPSASPSPRSTAHELAHDRPAGAAASGRCRAWLH